MANFTVKCQISVSGSGIRSEEDAIDAIRVMLGCWEDMDSTDTEISFRIETVNKA